MALISFPAASSSEFFQQDNTPTLFMKKNQVLLQFKNLTGQHILGKIYVSKIPSNLMTSRTETDILHLPETYLYLTATLYKLPYIWQLYISYPILATEQLATECSYKRAMFLNQEELKLITLSYI